MILQHGICLLLQSTVNQMLRIPRPVLNTVYNKTFEGKNFCGCHGILLTVNVKFSMKFSYLKSSWNTYLAMYMIATWNITSIGTQ